MSRSPPLVVFYLYVRMGGGLAFLVVVHSRTVLAGFCKVALGLLALCAQGEVFAKVFFPSRTNFLFGSAKHARIG